MREGGWGRGGEHEKGRGSGTGKYKKVSGASDDAPLFDEYLIFCPTVDSEKYSSWIELTGFSLLFSFGQNLDPEKFFFPFYDLLALFFPSIPCCFLIFRTPNRFPPLLSIQVFILSVPKICSSIFSEIFP